MRKQDATRLMVSLSVVAVAGVLWIGTAGMRYRHQIQTQTALVEHLQTQLDRRRAAIEELSIKREAVTQKRRRLEQRLTTLQTAGKRSVDWSDVLLQLSRIVPEELWIHGVTLNAQAITLEGVSVDHAMVSGFMRALDASDAFKSTTFTYTRKTELEEQAFAAFEVVTHYDSAQRTLK